MYLTLTDVCFKIHLNPYRTAAVTRMERFNDTIVLILTYFNFVLTDLMPEVEDKYLIGWFYVSLVSILLVANISVMVHGTVVDTTEECRRRGVEQHNYRLLLIRRIEMDIIVMSPLQKFRTYIGVDWLFA
jgi:hypothetical protein